MVKEFLICIVAATHFGRFECFSVFVQTSMSVKLISVMGMHSALTQWGVSPVPAILATLEMANTAQVEIY